MKRSKFKETQIIALLKQYEHGMKVPDLCREYGISQPTFYSWKSKYGGMNASQLKRLKEIEIENTKLKRMYADLALDNRVLKDVLEKKL
ncbi:transposase [Flavobacteriaceae bacterium]|nr:transposase [Flavobacteriaceae bacterium]